MANLPFTLGPYTVDSEIGRGGMGVVYGGQDEKLKRRVAIKAVAESLAAEPELMARFQREARLLAQLNSPQVATVYGIEEANSHAYLVMEFVDGESLAERLARGAISIEESLRIASEIASGLAAAHDAGVVHRDLKPGNVMLGKDGQVKVLDFGLARRQDEPEEADSLGPMTATGMIVGSPGYLSPEQAQGEELDRRTDVFAFGCVLYECLSGLRAFAGRNMAEAIHAVVHQDPDWTCLPAKTPTRIRELLERCLRKRPADRLRDLGDARLELATAISGREWASMTGRQESSTWAVLAIPVALLLGLLASPWMFGGTSASSDSRLRVTRFEVSPPAGQSLRLMTPGIRISPRSNYLSYYLNTTGGGSVTMVRPLDSYESRLLNEEGPALEPTFSPDDEWIAFNNGGKTFKTRVAVPGPVEIVSEEPVAYGMAWIRSGWIVYSGAYGSSLRKVSIEGGESSDCSILDRSRGEIHHFGPERAWGENSFLFQTMNGEMNWEESGIALGHLDGRAHKILTTGTLAFAVEPDLLVVCREHRLYGARVDVAAGELLHEPVPILDASVCYGVLNLPQYWVSTDGSLAYVEGDKVQATSQLHLLDRGGGGSVCAETLTLASWPDFSPSGDRVAFAAVDGSSQELLSWDVQRNLVDRVTAGTPTFESGPSWSPDGKRLRYHMHVGGQFGIHSKSSTGIGDAELITTVERGFRPVTWLPDESGFAAVSGGRADGSANRDLWIVKRKNGAWEAELFLEGMANDYAAAFSPDGRFLAYESRETGRSEVYVLPYPSKDERWRVSQRGGSAPRWSAQGELFFKNGGEIWAAKYGDEDGFESEEPVLLFDAREVIGGEIDGRFDVSADGQRFAILVAEKKPDNYSEPVIRVVLNWVETWRDLLPLK